MNPKNTVKDQLDAAWYLIKSGNKLDAVDCLYRAVLELATPGNQNSDPRVFRHNWTPEELAKRERMFSDFISTPKPLTLDDLKRQVDEASKLPSNWWDAYHADTDPLWVFGDFEIRRRK